MAAFAAALVSVVLVATPSLAYADRAPGVGSEEQILQAASSLSSSGVLTGWDAGKGVLNDYVTRGQLALMLARALNVEDSTVGHFDDLADSAESFGAVGALYEVGLVDGFSASTFAPDELISRQKAVRWIMDALGWKLSREAGNSAPYRLSYFESTGDWLGGFRDRGMIAPQYVRAVANACRLGLVDGTDDGWLYPALPLTWGDANIVVYRAFSSAPRVRAGLPERLKAESSYPVLKRDSEGPMVWYVQRHLAELKYFPGEIDGHYASHTADAVMAFQKVERLQRTGTVGESTWARLLVAETPAPVKTEEGSRIEVDLTRQVLFMITDNKVWKIVHVSTGAGNRRTRTGHFQIGDKFRGWVECVTVQGRMYYPSYVVSKTAIHGYSSVPSHPASHGCIRVPVWMAKQIWDETPTGMVVDIFYNK